MIIGVFHVLREDIIFSTAVTVVFYSSSVYGPTVQVAINMLGLPVFVPVQNDFLKASLHCAINVTRYWLTAEDSAMPVTNRNGRVMEAQKVLRLLHANRQMHLKAQRKNDRRICVLTWKRKNWKCEKKQQSPQLQTIASRDRQISNKLRWRCKLIANTSNIIWSILEISWVLCCKKSPRKWLVQTGDAMSPSTFYRHRQQVLGKVEGDFLSTSTLPPVTTRVMRLKHADFSSVDLGIVSDFDSEVTVAHAQSINQ